MYYLFASLSWFSLFISDRFHLATGFDLIYFAFLPVVQGKILLGQWLVAFFLHAHNNIFPYGHFQKKRKNTSSDSDLLLPLRHTWVLFHAHSERREPLLLGSYYIPINIAIL